MKTTIHDCKISTEKLWFGLFILYIISGYFAQDVLLPAKLNSIILYAFLAFSFFAIVCSGKLKVPSIVVWTVMFLCASFVAMMYSPLISFFSGTYYVLIVNFIIVLILSQMSFNIKKLNAIFATYTISGALLILLLALTGNLVDNSASGRLGQELLGNANILACMLMVSVMYGIWLLVTSKKKCIKFVWLIAIIIIYIGMFLSGGRKYVIAPIVFAYIVIINRKDKSGRKRIVQKTLLFGMIVFFIYQLIMNVPFFYKSIGVRFEGAFGIVDDTYTIDGSTIKRTQMIEAAFEQWLKNPIYGYGFDSFKYYNAKAVTGHMYYSHNNYMELLYNQGIIGFVIYYGFYIWLLIRALKKKNSINRSFILGTLGTLLLFEYFAISYSASPIQVLLFFCACFLNSSGQDSTVSKKE